MISSLTDTSWNVLQMESKTKQKNFPGRAGKFLDETLMAQNLKGSPRNELLRGTQEAQIDGGVGKTRNPGHPNIIKEITWCSFSKLEIQFNFRQTTSSV